ncbi:hypothetical protein FSP39_009120 [Pinctada imbricata]|uniref:Uncharacterized protein n=1 Tax=Pinctada imbricata TaxID=66713 RepID=A0AA88XLQ7_PINIB|nr:hypothetical protein FSP39_009120 [Pinctada imbricata]
MTENKLRKYIEKPRSAPIGERKLQPIILSDKTPIYSIKKWNEGKGHKDPATFEDQDEELASQIYTLNREARKINKSLGSHSPEFTSDLQTNRKVKVGDNRQLSTIKRYNFNLNADGIHPGTLLSKAWLKKIIEQIKRDCWDKQVGRNEPE